MDINEVFKNYVDANEDNGNLVTIAYDEMNSDQYEEAAAHFDQLYVKDPADYMSFFFRAMCKSHTGTRGNVYPDAQTLTSAFTMACKKAESDKKNYETNMLLLLHYYADAMDNLAYNAVEEVDSNGHTSNPTRFRIKRMMRENLIEVAKQYKDSISACEDLKAYVMDYLQKNLSFDLEGVGAAIVAYDPSFEATLKEMLKKRKIKNIIKFSIIGGIILAIIIAIIVAAV